MKKLTLPLLTLLLAACSSTTAAPVGDNAGEMSGNFSGDVSSVLYVDPADVEEQFTVFKQKLKEMGRNHPGKRALYEEYVPVIGANGVLEGIEDLWPKCHTEGHDLGKVIYAETTDIGTALRVCRDGCYSGCMHGVLMEAFAGARGTDSEGHVDVEIVKGMMDEICSNNSTMTDAYSPGDCAHAVGHALMVLADYNIGDAVHWCDEFSSTHMRYYCATGTYMEYVTERDREDTAAGKRPFYPCDAYKYPGACARYKMVHVIPRQVRGANDVPAFVRTCNELMGVYRLGCYHGVGNGFMGHIVQKKIGLMDVCGVATRDDDRFVCIEGAMERMVKYHPERARAVCADLPRGSIDRQTCEDSVERGMYDMEKDLSLYVME